MNNVVLIGRLTKDPELRYIPGSGTAIARFGLAVDKGLSKDKKQEFESKNQPTADFINIAVWGKSAENCANYLVKGRLVGIQGRISTNSYEKDGVKRYTTEVVASNVEFLEWGEKSNNQSNDYNNGGNEDPYYFGGFGTGNDDIPF
ncbi:single-stranded DNA-binding protein [Tissierella carlieri]|uniref:Single-stranded DNA-binding protein n=1 Tax=Tissierella carlieri TaxID=689904 RepID=A0ABT1SEJ2_9FIRM|nr:single-stranded DNA-binding protein [Tissierella carlieri]MCQ4924908.1 single-stranded DNA-binding protein [Tissierella carlieri]